MAARHAHRSRGQDQELLPRRPVPALRGCGGPSKAVTAVGHSILTAAGHMLQTGELYSDLGGDYFTRQNTDRLTKRLVLEALRTPRHPRALDVAA